MMTKPPPLTLCFLTALLVLLFSTPALAGPESGLVGFGLSPFKNLNYCASACQWAFLPYPLTCSATGPSSAIFGWATTSSECKATNDAWLTSVAWCFKEKCGGQYSVSQLEDVWETETTKDFYRSKLLGPPPPPKWTYQEALRQVPAPGPTVRLTGKEKVLNFTALVNDREWTVQYNTAWGVTEEQRWGAVYGIIVLVAGFSIPVLLTWSSYLPFFTRFFSFLAPYLTYPSALGAYQVRPLPYLLGNAPTRGQALYVVAFFALNVVLCSVNYNSMQPHAYYLSESDEIKAYIFYRTGIVGYALVPLVVLFSSRNNVLLLWLTDWSHATYLLLHRWVGRLFVLHALVHSFLALPLFLKKDYVVTSAYWAWGAVGTVLAVVMLAGSVLPVRRWSYELFLIAHVVLAVLLIAALWYHVVLWIGLGTYGYETWLYAACAVWFFDRAARVGRVLKNGVRRSAVTDLGNGYLRVDVPSVAFANDGPGLHIYVYFPTLSLWRPWENHPFSIVPTSLLVSKKTRSESGDSTPTTPTAKEEGVMRVDVVDVEKRQSSFATAQQQALVNNSGITLLIKKSTGITKYLQATGGLVTLMDGPYHNTPTKEVRRCDRLLLIGGGIGVTSLLPWITSHPNVKVYWSLRESARCLIDEIDGVLSRVESEVRVGNRLDIAGLLAQEAEVGYKKIGVVVSGPGGLCDDVRAAVVVAGKKGGAVFELEVDAYSW